MAGAGENGGPIPSTRAPAMTAVLAVSAGLCIARAWPGQFVSWWMLAVCCGIAWCGLFWLRKARASAAALLIGWGALAAGWHDSGWSWVATNDVSRLATNEGISVRLEAKVLEPAWIISSATDDSAPSWQPPERTLTNLACRRLVMNEESTVISGSVRMSLTGHYPELTCGDVIQVVGKLRVPAGPLNPGDFDFRTWLKNQGIRAVLQVESAESVQWLRRESRPLDVWGRLRQSFRSQARDLFLSSLSEETSGVAETLLLGGRRRIDDDLRQAFVNSGMLHVLAISGVNVALLGIWLMVLGRLAGFSSRQSLLASTIGLAVYAAVTDGDPPVIRATVMAVLGAVAIWSGRQAGMVQVVGVALFGMMLLHPSDLFDAGAQLSFLSVLTISRTLSAWQASERARAAWEPPLVGDGRWPEWMSAGWTAWRDCTLVSAAIWLATAPLVAWRFQMVSLAGLILNVILAPLIVILMWAGYSFLIAGMLVPILAMPLAAVFDVCLMALIRSVTWASSWRFSHVDLASPPDWWMVGYYCGAGALLLWPLSMSRQKAVVGGLAAWMVLGLAIGFVPRSPDGMACRFLAVGHGLSALIELPDGKTLLYDAGSQGDPERAARIVKNELRRRGRRRIDAVLISHADADHCNGLPELLKEVAIGTVLIGPRFAENEFPLPRTIVESCAEKKIPVRTLTKGDEVTLCPDVTIQLLHPAQEFETDKDNAMSLVAAIEYRGRRVLLTGDLEGEGLADVLSLPAWDCDVLLSPHHGSKGANPERMARWATPEWVVVSTHEAAAEDRLAAVYGDGTEVLSTGRRGAMEFRIDPHGGISVDTFRRASSTRAAGDR